MKTTNTINIFVAGALFFCSNLVVAYEVSTHAGMTNSAYGRSILSVSSTYDRLGLTTVSQRAIEQTKGARLVFSIHLANRSPARYPLAWANRSG